MFRIQKPEEVCHSDEKNRKTSIYSLAFHPKQKILATAGIDATIRLWDLNTFSLLQTLSIHNGAVMSIDFGGGYLASGSDGDNLVIVFHQIDGEWKCLKRLLGHESDVVDVKWSPNGHYLASCGLDQLIQIYSVPGFQVLKQLNQHLGFVKGLAWDPCHQYLASQSDDQSLMIYTVPSFEPYQIVKDRFEKASGSTFFKRLSWSPDGSFICGVHAVDEGQSIDTACLLSRNTFTEQVCLVGHYDITTCSQFSPVLYREAELILALGSQDGSVSLWSSQSSRAILALESVFTRPVFDLRWSPDGQLLAGCSGDGSVMLLSIGSYVPGTLTSADTEWFPTKTNSPWPVHIDKETVFGKPLDQAAIKERMKRFDTTTKSVVEYLDMQQKRTAETVMTQQTVTIKDGKKRVQPVSTATTSSTLPTTTTTQTAVTQPVSQPVSQSRIKSHTRVAPPVELGQIHLPQQYPLLFPTTKGKLSLQLLPQPNGKKYTHIIHDCQNEVYSWQSTLPSIVYTVYSTDDVLYLPTVHKMLYCLRVESGVLHAPPILLESPVWMFCLKDEYWMLITTGGGVYVFQQQSGKCLLDGISLAPVVLQNDHVMKVLRVDLRRNGMPVVCLENGLSYSYSLTDKYWFQLKDLSRTVLEVNTEDGEENESYFGGLYRHLLCREKQKWVQQSVMFMEEQLCLCRVLGEKSVYFDLLLVYARRISAAGMLAKVHSLWYFLTINMLTRNESDNFLSQEERKQLFDQLVPILSENPKLHNILLQFQTAQQPQTLLLMEE